MSRGPPGPPLRPASFCPWTRSARHSLRDGSLLAEAVGLASLCLPYGCSRTSFCPMFPHRSLPFLHQQKKGGLSEERPPLLYLSFKRRLIAQPSVELLAAAAGLGRAAAGLFAARRLAAAASTQQVQQAGTLAAAGLFFAAGRLSGAASGLGSATAGLAGGLAAAAAQQTVEQTDALLAAGISVAAGGLGRTTSRLGSAAALLFSAATAAEQTGFGALDTEQHQDGQSGQGQEQTSHGKLLGQREVNGESRQDFVAAFRQVCRQPFSHPSRFQFVPTFPRTLRVGHATPANLAEAFGVRGSVNPGGEGQTGGVCRLLATWREIDVIARFLPALEGFHKRSG